MLHFLLKLLVDWPAAGSLLSLDATDIEIYTQYTARVQVVMYVDTS